MCSAELDSYSLKYYDNASLTLSGLVMDVNLQRIYGTNIIVKITIVATSGCLTLAVVVYQTRVR